MAYLLGVDTGGTYTDAVILNDKEQSVLARAKSLTTRPDLSRGIGSAIDAVLALTQVDPAHIAMVSLSTTLATNALIEGQGQPIALVLVGFEPNELSRDGLKDAIADDPVIWLAGGHDHAGQASVPVALATLEKELARVSGKVSAFAVAARFATRNPEHEVQVRDCIRSITGKPVTCSHELSAALGGPKRALTAVLNARLIGVIDRLIEACKGHLIQVGVDAPLMVVRGDGALVSAAVAQTKPIETILSGPAASVAGAGWLTNEKDALVSDIGGTTTDICLLRDGRPKIDPNGAKVGPFRTMVEAVAMRTHGLGGDSEVHILDGLEAGIVLGPRRVLPVSLLAWQFPDLVNPHLELIAKSDRAGADDLKFCVPVWSALDRDTLDKREAALVTRLSEGARHVSKVVTTRVEYPALERLIARGLVQVSGVTPSDAAHVLGYSDAWDRGAAEIALSNFARRRGASGDRLDTSGSAMAARIVGQLRHQTARYLLESAFAEDDRNWEAVSPQTLAQHVLTTAGLDHHAGLIKAQLSIGLPVIGLGASATAYYGPVGDRLGTRSVVPEHADVANAIGAVVGQVSANAEGTITAQGAGRYVVHSPNGTIAYDTEEAATGRLEADLIETARAAAQASGVDKPEFETIRDVQRAQIEGSDMFVSATVRVRAFGRPRIAVS